MGAISDTLMTDGFALTQDIHGQTVTVTSGDEQGRQYAGVILVVPPDSLLTDLSEDLREKTVIHFANASWPKGAKPGDQCKDADGNIWQFVRMINNPADATVDWEVIRFVPEIDS